MTLGFYLTRYFGARLLLTWLVFALLGVSIDLFRAANDIIALGGAARLLEYSLLRTPQIMMTLFPVTLLIGAGLSFFTLGSHQEIIILRASGSGMVFILSRLFPLILVLGVFYGQVGDQINSWTATHLAISFPETQKEAPVGSEFWVRDGNDIIRATLGNKAGTRLYNLTHYRANEKGHIIERQTSKQAIYINGHWFLINKPVPSAQNLTEVGGDIWQTRLDPKSVRKIASNNNDVSAGDARAALSGIGVATRSESYYQTRIARSYSVMLLPLVLFTFAAMGGLGNCRGNNGLKLAVYGCVLGFVYIIAEGILSAVGETGGLSPYIATLLPTILFFGIGFWALIYLDD